LILIFIGYRVVAVRVPQVTFMPPGMILFFVLFGVIIAALGSAVSLRAFMQEKERR
jgi:predicted tellurium resistance membrane protein TerC